MASSPSPSPVSIQAVELAPGASREYAANGTDLPSPSAEQQQAGSPETHKLAPRLSSTGALLPTLQDYLAYVKMLYAPNCWRDAPSVSLTYDHLSYTLKVPKKELANPSVSKAFVDMFRKIPTTELRVFHDLTGYIPAGRMTLVLAPPGGGKSAYLKALAGHLRNNKNVTGELLYDGLSSAQQLTGGVFTEKLCALVAQGDVHMANLTVRETLQFALDNSVVPPTPELFGQQTLDPRLIDYHRRKVDLLLSVLGMHECAETIAGNDMIRGVSGGQKKRLTIGELMVTNARVLLLDEPTTGLDAAVSRDIMVVLREWCQVSGGTVLAALLQATPECFELYDDIICMRDGVIVYHGPRQEVQQYMEQHWGLAKPDDVDLADFIIEVLTNPEQQFKKQQRAFRHGKNKRHFDLLPSLPAAAGIKGSSASPALYTNGHASTNGNGHAASAAAAKYANGTQAGPTDKEVSVVRFHDVEEQDVETSANRRRQQSLQQQPFSPQVEGHPRAAAAGEEVGDDDHVPLRARRESEWIISTEAMLASYVASPYFQLQRAAVDKVKSEQTEKAAAINSEQAKANRTPYTLQQYGQLYTRGFSTHTRLSLARQFTLLKRDKQTVPPRAFSAIIQSLIFGSLFFRLSDSNFYPKIGILLFSLMFFAMGNFTELPATFEGRNAVYKQVDAGMFPTLSYMIAIFLASIPIVLLESFLYSIILYFMIGLAEDAGRFFIFWLCMILTDLMFGTGFRAICYKVVSIDQAQQVAMPFMNVMMIYSGFLILHDEIKDWQIEFYWLSPFSWLVRTLSINEFNADKYGGPGPVGFQDMRLGDFYLSSFQVPSKSAYKWAGVGFIIAYVAFFTWIGAHFLKTTRFDLLQGTKRTKADADVLPLAPGAVPLVPSATMATASNATAADGQTVPAPGSEQLPRQNGQTVVQIAPQRQVKKLSALASHSSAVSMNSVLPFQPTSFAFEHIHYSVPVVATDGPSKGKTYQKPLLCDVSGFVKPGQLVALMGSSGAGKTTLIDVVAGRKTSGEIKGNIFVNGQLKSKNEALFKRTTAYAEQRDMHMPLATVRESLLFSARLRLPATVTEQQRKQFVEELLDILELRPLADRIVGNEKYAGLSPGQLKLLTIGVELASNPSILFLDEPTSGLDSRAAVVVMRVVSKIAATGRSVLCTIHQPSSDVFFFFDAMLLLRSGGRTVFFGELGFEGKHLVDYFQSHADESGEYPRIPEGQNPASWMLDVTGAGLSGALKRAQARKAQGDSGAKAFDWADVYEASELCKGQTKQLEAVAHPVDKVEQLVKESDYDIPLAVKAQMVIHRGFTSYWRDSLMNFGRAMMLVVLSLIFGIVYVQLDANTYAGLTSKTSAVFSIAGFIAMLSAQTTLPNVFGERAVYYREQASSMYPSWIYSTTTALTEIPYIFITTLFGTIIFYFMVGYEHDATLFFQFWCSLSILVMIESSFGQLAAALLPNFVVAIQLAGALNTLFFLFGGLFIRPADIPKGWQWFYYMNPIPKAIIAIVLPQFECHLPNPYDVNSGCPVILDPTTATPITVHAYTQQQWDCSYDNVFGRMIGWLILTYFVFRLGIWASFRYINHLKR